MNDSNLDDFEVQENEPAEISVDAEENLAEETIYVHIYIYFIHKYRCKSLSG